MSFRPLGAALLVALALPLGGCLGGRERVDTFASAVAEPDESDEGKARADCRNDTRRYQRSPSATNERARGFFVDCMRGKGWKLTATEVKARG